MKTNNIHSNCDSCGVPLYKGKTYVSIMKNVEQLDYNEEEGCDEVEVLEADDLIVLCRTCGNMFDTKTLKSIIKLIPPDSERLRQN